MRLTFIITCLCMASYVDAHGAVTIPRPRNSIDSDVAPWANGVPTPVAFENWFAPTSPMLCIPSHHHCVTTKDPTHSPGVPFQRKVPQPSQRETFPHLTGRHASGFPTDALSVPLTAMAIPVAQSQGSRAHRVPNQATPSIAK